MDEGLHTALAALVTEGLCVDLVEERVVQGPVSPAYDNASVLEAPRPCAAFDEHAPGRRLRTVLDLPGKRLGYQITDGASSLPDASDKMRMAGAVSRDALLATTSRQSGVAPRQLHCAGGFISGPNHIRLDYRHLAADMQVADMPDRCAGRVFYTRDALCLPALGAGYHAPLICLDALVAKQMPDAPAIASLPDGVAVVALDCT